MMSWEFYVVTSVLSHMVAFIDEHSLHIVLHNVLDAVDFISNSLIILQIRVTYSQISGEAPGLKESTGKSTGNTRGKGEGKSVSKDANSEASPVKEGVSGIQDRYKAFCLPFVRLNGILFTRTRYFVLNAVFNWLSLSKTF